MRAGLGFLRRPLGGDEAIPPEHDLVESSAAVLDTLYRRERAGLLRFVIGRSRREDAEDVVQQAFTRFIAGGNAGQIENPGAYLRQSAVNLLRDGARLATRERMPSAAPLQNEEIADCDPVAALEARDRLRRIESAVAKLKPLTRRIFLARRVYGYSLAEISEQTGLSKKGVERHMAIAIRQLGRHLRSHG